MNVQYEFINVGGKRMSTLAGLGFPPTRSRAVIPPNEMRLLFVRHRPNVAFEFDPVHTDAVPRHMDEFDRLAAATAGRAVRGELPADADRIFSASLVDPEADPAAEADAYRPGVWPPRACSPAAGDRRRRAGHRGKGSAFPSREFAIVDERTRSAHAWLDDLRPRRRAGRGPARRPPGGVADLAPDQRAYCAALADGLAHPARDRMGGEGVQSVIFATAKERGSRPGRPSPPCTLRSWGSLRPARRLAARLARSALRAGAAPGRRRRRVISIQAIRDDPDAVKMAIARKGEGPEVIDRLLTNDAATARGPAAADAAKHERNAGSKEVGEPAARRPDRRGGSAQGIARLARRADRGPGRAARVREAGARGGSLLVPNPPRDEVPDGRRPRGQPGGPLLGRAAACRGAAAPLGHRRALNLFDLERGAKIAGHAASSCTRAPGARLERALIGLLLDMATHTATPRSGPRSSSTRTRPAAPARSRQGGADVRRRARRPVPGPHRRGAGDEHPSRRDPGCGALPIRYAAYTPCFRREAGAAGKDTRGLLRRAPVRQGRAREVRHARDTRTSSWRP